MCLGTLSKEGEPCAFGAFLYVVSCRLSKLVRYTETAKFNMCSTSTLEKAQGLVNQWTSQLRYPGKLAQVEEMVQNLQDSGCLNVLSDEIELLWIDKVSRRFDALNEDGKELDQAKMCFIFDSFIHLQRVALEKLNIGRFNVISKCSATNLSEFDVESSDIATHYFAALFIGNALRQPSCSSDFVHVLLEHILVADETRFVRLFVDQMGRSGQSKLLKLDEETLSRCVLFTGAFSMAVREGSTQMLQLLFNSIKHSAQERNIELKTVFTGQYITQLLWTSSCRSLEELLKIFLSEKLGFKRAINTYPDFGELLVRRATSKSTCGRYKAVEILLLLSKEMGIDPKKLFERNGQHSSILCEAMKLKNDQLVKSILTFARNNGVQLLHSCI